MVNLNDDIVLRVLALAIEDGTPDHHLRYLLKKLHGFDGCGLDSSNTKIYEKLKLISEELNNG